MDMVEYFAALGSSARIRMFHARRADLTGTDCPYELAIAAKEQLQVRVPSILTLILSAVLCAAVSGPTHKLCRQRVCHALAA